MWDRTSDASKRKEKQMWAIEKPKPEDCVVFFFFDPDDEEFKGIMINARRKLESPMPAAMPCRLQRGQDRETCCTVGEHKTKYACIVEANESVRGYAWKDLRTRIMKITLQEEEWIHWVTTVWCTNVFLCPQAMKIPRCKGSSGERIRRKLKKIPGMAADESQRQNGGNCRSTEWRKNCTHCVIDGSLSSQEFGFGTTISKIPRSSRTPRRHCERWFRIVRSIHWARIISFTSDGCKSDGCHIKAIRKCGTSSRRNICSYSGQKWKMHWRHWKFPNQNVQIFGYVYRNRSGQRHGPVWKNQSFFLSEMCTVILWQDYYGKDNFEKSLLEHGCGKSSKLRMFIRQPIQRTILICVCGR